jgi:hypothetical protein
MFDLFKVQCSPVNGLHPVTDSQETLSLFTISTRSILSRTFAEEDREFWGVIKHSENEKDSVCEDRGFEEIDVFRRSRRAAACSVSVVNLSDWQLLAALVTQG